MENKGKNGDGCGVRLGVNEECISVELEGINGGGCGVGPGPTNGVDLRLVSLHWEG